MKAGGTASEPQNGRNRHAWGRRAGDLLGLRASALDDATVLTLAIGLATLGFVSCGAATPARHASPVAETATPAPTSVDRSSPLGARAQVYAGARAAMKHGPPELAERELARSEEVLPELADYALIDGARLARARGDRDAARAKTERLLTEHPDSVWFAAAAVERGNLALDDGDAAGALSYFDRAIAAGSAEDTPAATLGQARAKLALGDLPGAYAAADGLRGSGGETGEAARQLAETLAAKGAPALGLDRTELSRREAEALLREGNPSEAAARLEPLLAPDSPARGEGFLLLARARTRQGSVDEAFVAYGEASRASNAPDVAGTALYERGRALWNRNDDAAATRDFEALRERFPDHPKAPEALHALGRIAETSGDTEKAARLYEEVAQRYPGDPLARELAWRAGFVRYLGGDPKGAIRTFEALGDGPDPTYWRARALAADREEERAREIYRSLETSPSSDAYLAWWVDTRLGTSSVRASRSSASVKPSSPPAPFQTSPPSLAGAAAYHFTRAEILRSLALRTDATREYTAVEAVSGPDPMLLDYYREVGAYPAMVRLARRLESNGASGAYDAYLYPSVFSEEFASAGRRSGIDPLLLLAVARQESLFDANARSPAGARGLMQLMPATATAVAGPEGADAALTSPAPNVDVGARYLRSLLDRYDGRIVPAVAAYNAGPDAVARWQTRAAGREGDEFVELISYRETKGYVKAVLRNYRVYLAQSGSEPSPPLRLY